MTLVTGATGFVGSVLVRQLVEAGEPVRVLRRPTSRLDLLGDAAHHVEHAEGDVTDAGSVRAATRGVRRVYHVAAVVAFGPRVRRRLQDVNVRGTAHVVDAAREAGVERLVHTSSIAALGRPAVPGGVIDEATAWVPSRQNTAYAASKRASELEVLRGVAEGLDAVTVNPALVFGPGRPGEGTMRLVERVAAGRVVVAPPGGTAVVDVEDVALGLRAAMAVGETGGRYVLAAENLPWTTVLGTLAEALGVAPPRWTLGPRALRWAGAVAEAAALLTGADPALTRATARTASVTYRYANRKAVEDLGLSFRPFAATAARLPAPA
jgi:dihydroflavonol-4-reductase